MWWMPPDANFERLPLMCDARNVGEAFTEKTPPPPPLKATLAGPAPEVLVTMKLPVNTGRES